MHTYRNMQQRLFTVHTVQNMYSLVHTLITKPSRYSRVYQFKSLSEIKPEKVAENLASPCFGKNAILRGFEWKWMETRQICALQCTIKSYKKDWKLKFYCRDDRVIQQMLDFLHSRREQMMVNGVSRDSMSFLSSTEIIHPIRNNWMNIIKLIQIDIILKLKATFLL